ncbi:hypothetical protein WMY93_012114 [Mugilogobius chulae]|uniref:Uncharacterized protein n=1 Tax=Mugilogobius chulae TaxID=88201 RepID=A0AAW0PAM6_9GOBI
MDSPLGSDYNYSVLTTQEPRGIWSKLRSTTTESCGVFQYEVSECQADVWRCEWKTFCVAESGLRGRNWYIVVLDAQ